MFHIVFQPADAARLKEAAVLDRHLSGEILVIKDDFSLGPFSDQEGKESFQERKNWWDEVLRYSPYTDQTAMVDDRLTVHQLKKQLEEDISAEVWIWMAQNAHDVCGYLWLIGQFSKYQGRVFILYLNNLPFINEKGGLFYPNYLFEIRPAEYLKAKKLARPVTLSEFEIDGDEFKKLCTANNSIRLLEGGKKITGKEAGYFDTEILKLLQTDNQKLLKIINSFIAKNGPFTSDAFLAWRIRQMAEERKLEVSGNWENGWKEMSVKAVEAVEGK